MAHRSLLVLGLGNPLAGDDGFGPAVIAQLRERRELAGAVELCDAGTDLLGRVEAFAHYESVVLVDVAVGAGPAGEVEVIDEAAFAEWPASWPGSHELSPLLVVRLFRRLHPGAATRVTLVALHSHAIGVGPGVSADAVARGAAAVLRLIGRPARG
jgi:hydrogenase maturation protease